MKRCVLLAVLGSSLLVPRVYACGVSGPDGVWSCSLEEHEEEERPKWNVAISSSYTATALRFGDVLRADQTRVALLASAAYAPTAALSFEVSAGAALAGSLRTPSATYDFSPGPATALGVRYRLRMADPFIVLSGVLSTTSSATHARGEHDQAARYTAFDLRLGGAVGATLFAGLSIYAVARVFGGPVFWRDQGQALVGTDVSHYQLGAGASWLISERVDVFFEGIPLGERALAGGAALVF